MPGPGIVVRTDRHVAPTRFEVSPFQRPRPDERMRFEVNLVAEAGEKMRKRAQVKLNLDSWSTFEIACDEGTALGGEGSAPPPLSYLAAGIAFCLLTHLQTLSRQWELRIDGLRVEQRMRFSTQPAADSAENPDADAYGSCDGIETHVLVDGEEDAARVRTLVDRAWRACMAMQTAVNATSQETRIHLNGHSIE